ncbi:NADH-quinone oxidoreductase subunit K [Bacteroidia bacterium]|nr:NADH-quinone oxidoreductase subunit K [Bacteroidia bacterium]
MIMIRMEYYLIISTLMFFIGIYGFISRKNMIAILISLELVLNAVEINFAVFNRYLFPGQLEGMFFTLFGIAITAAETAVALAIIINAYRAIGNIDIKNLSKMKE